MNHETQIKALEAARLYYEQDWSQMDIAAKLGLSRARISRLLKLAKDEGIVKIIIRNTFSDLTELTTRIRDKYKLKEVLVEDCDGLDSNGIRRVLSYSAAQYIGKIVTDNTSIGMSWGRTVYDLVFFLEPKTVNGVSVLPLKGSVGNGERVFLPLLTLMRAATCYNANASFLPIPLLLETREQKESLMRDDSVREIWNRMQHVDIAVFSIAPLSDQSVIFRSGFLPCENLETMREGGAVCDICTHYLTEDGEIFDANLDARITSVPIAALKNTPYSIGIRGGVDATKGIKAAILSGGVNILVTDKQSALRLIE